MAAAALGCAAGAGHAGEIAGPGPALASSADANTCSTLSADAGRLASKFTLGQRACAARPRSDVGAAAPPPPREQAQQLYLYDDSAGEPARGTPTPMSSPLSTLSRERAAPVWSQPLTAPARPQRAPMKTPTRTISQDAADRALRLAGAVDAAARAHNIDPLLLHAIARVESRHDPSAISRAGARGVLQVMPATARRFGVDSVPALHHASTNIQVGAAYLKTLQERFGNNLVLVLAAYNAGEGAVERYGRRVPPYAETQGYVRDVMAEYRRLRG